MSPLFTHWIYIPLAVPLVIALYCIISGKSSVTQRAVVLAGNLFVLLSSFILLFLSLEHSWLALTFGGWSVGIGITIAVDPLAAIMLILSSITAIFCILYQFAETPIDKEHPLRTPLLHFLLAGINLSFLTSDIFNLYVAFELMLLASFGLMTLEQKKNRIQLSMPYVLINVFGSLFFLICCGLIYSYAGTLNFAYLSKVFAGANDATYLQVLCLILTLVMGVKAGVFPLYYWLPNSYPSLPIPILAFYSGMLTKVGVYVLLRLNATVFPDDFSLIHDILLWIAAFTMIFGVLGAISRNFTRGILSFHIISQIGFMVIGIGLYTMGEDSTLPVAYPLAACVFYIIHHIIVKSSLFLIGGTASHVNGSDNLEKTGNLWLLSPALGILFLFQSLSLAGIPPLSGFWGKYMLMVAGVAQEKYWIVFISVIASVLTLFSMLKIWNGVFWKHEEHIKTDKPSNYKALIAVCMGMVAISLWIGLNAETVFQISLQASEIALDKEKFQSMFISKF